MGEWPWAEDQESEQLKFLKFGEWKLGEERPRADGDEFCSVCVPFFLFFSFLSFFLFRNSRHCR